MPTTDYHTLIRDAIKTALDTALTVTPDPPDDPYVFPLVVALDDLDKPVTASLPFVGVACVGPEQDRSDFGTNQQSGIGFPCIVGLFSVGAANGAKAPQVPELTAFRRLVHVTFHMKRLSGVAQVGYCEVSDAGFLDRKLNAFEKLSTLLIVTAVGRFPRS